MPVARGHANPAAIIPYYFAWLVDRIDWDQFMRWAEVDFG